MNAWKRMIAALLAASLFSACSPSAAGGTASQATAEETAAASAQPETEPAAALRGQGGMKVLLEMAKTRENFDYEAFFKAYAQNWSRINTYEAEQNNLNYDSLISDLILWMQSIIIEASPSAYSTTRNLHFTLRFLK